MAAEELGGGPEAIWWNGKMAILTGRGDSIKPRKDITVRPSPICRCSRLRME